MFGIASALSLALTLHATASLAAAIPTDSGLIPKGLWEPSADGKRIAIFISKVNATIFGVDAEGFDFEIGGDPESLKHSIESAETFAKVWFTGDADAILVAFLNQTTGGYMDPKKPFDRHFLCNDLSCPMNEGTSACDGIEVACWEDMRVEL
jgi:hypothetical protein